MLGDNTDMFGLQKTAAVAFQIYWDLFTIVYKRTECLNNEI